MFSISANLNSHKENCKELLVLELKNKYEEKIKILIEENSLLKIKELNQSEMYEKKIYELMKLHEKEKSSIEKSLEYIYKLHEKEKAFLQQQNEIIHKSYENLSNNMDAIEFEETNENL